MQAIKHSICYIHHSSLSRLALPLASHTPPSEPRFFPAASTSAHVKTCEGQRGEHFIFPFTAAANSCFQFLSAVKCLCTVHLPPPFPQPASTHLFFQPLTRLPSDSSFNSVVVSIWVDCLKEIQPVITVLFSPPNGEWFGKRWATMNAYSLH